MTDEVDVSSWKDDTWFAATRSRLRLGFLISTAGYAIVTTMIAIVVVLVNDFRKTEAINQAGLRIVELMKDRNTSLTAADIFQSVGRGTVNGVSDTSLYDALHQLTESRRIHTKVLTYEDAGGTLHSVKLYSPN